MQQNQNFFFQFRKFFVLGAYVTHSATQLHSFDCTDLGVLLYASSSNVASSL